jgi:glyoxalase family protein
MITGDAPANVDFYAGLLGLRLIKKTVNFDAPQAYHLYFGDEQGTPGSILTWFEFPGAARGRPGAGTIHTIRLAVSASGALDFWAARLGARAQRLGDDVLAFADDDGLAFELAVDDSDPPLRAAHPEIPAEHAICGISGARAYSHGDPAASHSLLADTLGFSGGYVLEGAQRHFSWVYDPPPAEPARQGAGSVHHIAWASRDEDHLAWQERAHEAGARVTEVLDRDYFRSIYFREPQGVLFEIATMSPGFAVDEDPAHLGEQLRLPRQHEHLRAQLERSLVPVVNPRAALSA